MLLQDYRAECLVFFPECNVTEGQTVLAVHFDINFKWIKLAHF